MSSVIFSNKKSLPVILQTEAAECGLACIAMVASFFGFKTGLSDLRKSYSFSTQQFKVDSHLSLAPASSEGAFDCGKGFPYPVVLYWR